MNMQCPDEETLVEYAEGRLSGEDRSQLEEHLSVCQLCLETLVVAKDMVGEMDRFELEPVPDNVTEAAVDLVARECFRSGGLIVRFRRSIKDTVSRVTDSLLGPWGALQPVPIRGPRTVAAEDLVRVTVSFKEINTEIEIEKAGEGKAHIRVKPDLPAGYPERMRVTLKKGDREIASYPLEGDQVFFEDIPFDHYSISLAGNGEQLGTYLFEITDTGHAGK
ncbi:MAG: zf-HC2 domain-containing protein [Deltaproteobacteria bacterium]|nr:MAG: zf-HC2 domain-containing protein [Deltaproteobacteria bacterium]